MSVVVSGLSGHVGDDLAGVLYEESQLLDLHIEPVGGFWSEVASDEFTTTEVLRTLRPLGEARFPFVSDEALLVEPGTYTLVVWVDTELNASGWVPINTDGRGLFGCQVVFDVTDEAQTEVDVQANLRPDGWNADCATGETIPGTDARSQVDPYAESTVGSMELPITVTVSVDGTVYASFDDGEWQQAITNTAGGYGFAVTGSVLPMEELDDRESWALSQVLGEAWLAGGGETDGGASMSQPDNGDTPNDDPVSYAPGVYRLVFEAWVPSGPMRFGCEVDLHVVEGQESVLNVPSLPSYSGDGIHWSNYADLRFPDCPT